MIHEMRLHLIPFYEIKTGRNKKEIRLYDDKRKKINIGDFIVFKKRPEYDESFKVRVVDIKRYKTYSDLLMGNPDQKNISLDFYSKEDVAKYGFVVFEINVVK